MPDEPPSLTLERELTTNIVAAYVSHNQIGADQLSVLISTVHQALVGLGKPAAETEIERTPAVSIQQSVHRDYVVCLDCGWRYKAWIYDPRHSPHRFNDYVVEIISRPIKGANYGVQCQIHLPRYRAIFGIVIV